VKKFIFDRLFFSGVKGIYHRWLLSAENWMYFMSINKMKPGADHSQFNKVIAAHREWVHPVRNPLENAL
jgi:hypothetical protein